MTYRDEREALHAKSEALQSELDQTRRELERLRMQQAEGDEPEPSTREPAALRSARCDQQRGAIARMMVGSMLLATGLVGALAVRHHAVVDRYHHAGVMGGGLCPRVFYEAVHATGRVTSESNASVAANTPCTIDVSPVPMRRFNCRVEVRCGGQTLYGTPNAGYTHCDVAGGRPSRAADRFGRNADGDPELKLDLDASRVVVSDDADHSSVTITLTH